MSEQVIKDEEPGEVAEKRKNQRERILEKGEKRKTLN